MKIVFEGSELKEGIIKVSLDGGFTFADYEIADVKESGIPLDDSQRYDKIKIKGPANVLKSLDIVSNVKVEGGQSEQTNPDYDTHIEWYSWKSDDGEIIFTKTDDKTQDCIIYEKRPVDEEGHSDYVEFPSASRIAFSWTDNGILESWAGGPGIQTYLYSRAPEGDVVVQEPKKIDFYSWNVIKGRAVLDNGMVMNGGTVIGTLYTTKNPETDTGTFIFYSIGNNDEVSIEFIIDYKIGLEVENRIFDNGGYCIYKNDNCIMFNGGEEKQLNIEMDSVPVETVKTPLYSKKDNNYYAWKTPSGLVCYTRTLNPFENLEVFSLVPEDIVSPETYIPKFRSATGESTMFGTGAIFTWQNETLHYYNAMVKGSPEDYDLQRYEDGDYYLPPIITINPPTWFDRTDPLSSIVPKGEYIMAEGHQRLGNGLSSLRDVWFDGWNFFIRTTDDFDCIYSGLDITEQGVVHHITGGRLGWSDCH